MVWGCGEQKQPVKAGQLTVFKDLNLEIDKDIQLSGYPGEKIFKTLLNAIFLYIFSYLSCPCVFMDILWSTSFLLRS